MATEKKDGSQASRIHGRLPFKKILTRSASGGCRADYVSAVTAAIIALM